MSGRGKWLVLPVQIISLATYIILGPSTCVDANTRHVVHTQIHGQEENCTIQHAMHNTHHHGLGCNKSELEVQGVHLRKVSLRKIHLATSQPLIVVLLYNINWG